MRFKGSLRHIRLFIASYEERSFTAASVRENCTQSGVSHHIRQLEELLGTTLFIRDKLGVTATPAADELYQACVQTLRDLDEIPSRMSRFSEGYQGSFAIGMTPVLTHRLVTRPLLEYRERNPNVQVRIAECTSETARQMIVSGQLDFAIGSVPGGEGLRARRLLTTQESLIGSATRQKGAAPNAAGSRINLVLPVLTPKRHAAVGASLAAQGIGIASELRIDSALAILDLVGRSDWVTVAPSLILDPVDDEQRFVTYPLSEQPLNLSLYAIEPASRSITPEAQAFLDLLIEHAKRVNRHWTEALDRDSRAERKARR